MNVVEKLTNGLREDNTVRSLVSSINNDQNLKIEIEKLYEKGRYVRDGRSAKKLLEEFCRILEKDKKVNALLNSIKRKYGSQVRSLESFANKLQNSPNDVDKLIKVFFEKYGGSSVDKESRAISTELSSKKSSKVVRSCQKVEGKVTLVTKSSAQISTNRVYSNGKNGEFSQLSSHLVVKQDINGNVWVYVPGHGWVNPTWFPGFWILVILFFLFDCTVTLLGWIIQLVAVAVAFLWEIFWIIIEFILWLGSKIVGG